MWQKLFFRVTILVSKKLQRKNVVNEDLKTAITKLKTIIQSEPHQVGGESVVRARHRELAIIKVEIEPLGLRRPMLRKAHFGAEAGCPAQAGMAFGRTARCAAGQFAVGQSGAAEDQDVVDGDAGASAHRTEPGIGKLPECERVRGGRQIDICLAAIDEITCLPIETGFESARDAGGAR